MQEAQWYFEAEDPLPNNNDIEETTQSSRKPASWYYLAQYPCSGKIEFILRNLLRVLINYNQFK